MKIFDVGVVLTPATGGLAPENSGYDGDPITPAWVTEYVSENACDLVVGVEMWYNVRAVRSGDDIILTAKIRTVDVIEGQNYDGQQVTAEWLKGYIEGAEWYLLAPQCVKVSAVQVTPSQLPAGLVP